MCVCFSTGAAPGQDVAAWVTSGHEQSGWDIPKSGSNVILGMLSITKSTTSSPSFLE